LLEPQRTNLILRSEDFDLATWTKVAASVTANSTTSPSGLSNADTLTADGTSNSHQIQQTPISVISGTTYTYSVYAKKNTNNFIQLTGFDAGFGLIVFANFDLNNGVVGSVGVGTTASIQSVGNGWYRCSINLTAILTVAAGIQVYIVTSATAARKEANTLSTSVFLWGAQLEAGAYQTSYIPTSSATVTRNTDSFTLSNVFTNNLISSAGGTWFVGLKNNILLSRDNSGNTMTLGDTGSNNAFRFRNDGTPNTQLRVQKVVGGTASDLFLLSTSTVKIAIKWNGSTCDVFVNGIKVVSASAFTPTILENLTTAPQVPIYINSMALWNTPLTDDELEVITGEGFDTYALMASNYNYILQ
jgi:hypothetical protein